MIATRGPDDLISTVAFDVTTEKRYEIQGVRMEGVGGNALSFECVDACHFCPVPN